MASLSNKLSAAYAENSFRVRYLGGLAAIGVLILIAQILLQWQLAGQQHDARVIDVAGRQRTFSQKIVRAGQNLIGMGSNEARRGAYDELREAMSQLQRAHAGLQRGDNDLGLPGGNSTRIVQMFGNIEADYQAMIGAANSVLATYDRPGEVYQFAQRLTHHEAAFASGMDAITNQYVAEAGSKISRARWLGAIFGVAALGVLVFVSRRIIDPAMARLQRDMQRYEGLGKEMDKFFSSGPGAVFMIDPQSLAIVRANRKAEVLMGSPAADFLNRPLVGYFDARLDANKVFMNKLRAGESCDELPVLLIDARRNAVDALASMRPISLAGQPRYLVGITDVTAAHKPHEA